MLMIDIYIYIYIQNDSYSIMTPCALVIYIRLRISKIAFAKLSRMKFKSFPRLNSTRAPVFTTTYAGSDVPVAASRSPHHLGATDCLLECPTTHTYDVTLPLTPPADFV